MSRWRAIPLALRVGTSLQVLIAATFLIDGLLIGPHTGDEGFARWIKLILTMRGLDFVSAGFVLFGAIELSRLLVGRAAIGAKIAAVGWAIHMVFTVAWIAFAIDPELHHPIAAYVSWAWFAASALGGVGLAVAAIRIPVVAAIGGLAWTVLQLPPPLHAWLEAKLADHRTELDGVQSVIEMSGALLLVGLAFVAVANSTAMPAAQRARTGLDWIAKGLWLRVLATVAVPLTTLMAAGENGHSDPRAMMGKALVIAGLVSIVSSTLVGFGALDIARSNHPEVRREPFLGVAMASLWSAGVTIMQLSYSYKAMIKPPVDDYGMPGLDQRFATSLSTVQPLVAIAGLIAIALVVGGFATARGNLALGERGWRSAILVGTLQLSALAVAHILLPDVPNLRAFVIVTLGILIAGIYATLNVARLASDAKILVEEPLPVATLV